MFEAIIYLLAVTIAEVLTTLYQPLWGIIAHVIVLFAVILHTALGNYQHQQLGLSLTLVPLVRIISLSMPLANIPQLWWYPIIYVPLFAAAMLVVRLQNYKRQEIGFSLSHLGWQLLTALSGLGLGVIEYFILRPESWVKELSFSAIWLPALVLSSTTGFVEEFIFRGVLQHSAVQAFGAWRGITYVALLFAVLHMGFLSWVDVVFVLAVAMIFGWMVKRTGSFVGVALAHGITNSVLYLIAPFIFK